MFAYIGHNYYYVNDCVAMVDTHFRDAFACKKNKTINIDVNNKMFVYLL